MRLPGFFSQFSTLLSRRWRIFSRDRGQVLLQLAILLCFPLLVTIFSDKASGNIRRYSDTRSTDFVAEIQEIQSVRADQAKVGSAVSGIIMFQVVLLALMGSNNSAREIAGERPIYEKEKFGGLRPSAYLASKVVFLSLLVVAQSLWMAFFVNFFGQFRGDFVQHAVFLLLVNAAMTSICLAISAWMRTAEQASLLSIYLVGFQLPLSGAVLELAGSLPVRFGRAHFRGAHRGMDRRVTSAVGLRQVFRHNPISSALPYDSRRPAAIGSRAARIAGNRPPRIPMAVAKRIAWPNGIDETRNAAFTWLMSASSDGKTVLGGRQGGRGGAGNSAGRGVVHPAADGIQHPPDGGGSICDVVFVRKTNARVGWLLRLAP